MTEAKTTYKIYCLYKKNYYDKKVSREEMQKIMEEIWLPADKSVLIEDVENIVNQLKPKPNHQTNAHGCSMLFDELILKLKSLKSQ